ncbi:MAG: cellulose-binding protein CttA-related protein [Ruminococcus sp.]|nr:cellulose-binding protein CttA-related protein [Ruminococcus sp.]
MLERYRTMKNSLFKRAIAAAAAVPLALTQCLTYANAVSTNQVAGTVKVQAEEKGGVTIEDLLYIPADQTVSKWNKNLLYKFASFEGKSGSIDVNEYAEEIISKAGDYKDVAEYALNLLSDVNYNLKSNLDLVISGKVAEPDFNELIKSEMNGASKAPKAAPGRSNAPKYELPEGFDTSILPEGIDIDELKNIDLSTIDKSVREDLAEKYGIPELASDDVKTIQDLASVAEITIDNDVIKNIAQDYVAIEMSDIDFTATDEEPTKVGGEFIVTIKGSDLNSGTSVSAEFEYKCNDGNTYYLGQLPKFFQDSLKAIKAAGDKGIQEKFQKSLADTLQKKYDEKLDKFIAVAGEGNRMVTYFLGSQKREKTYANVSEAIARVNQFLADKGRTEQIPATATDIAANETVLKYYAKAMEATDNKFNISAADLGKFADSLMNIKAETEGAKGKVTFTVPESEKEINELSEYLAKQGYVLVNSYKKITAATDLSGLKTKEIGDVDVQIERVLVTDTTTTVTTTDNNTTTTVTTSMVKQYLDYDTDDAYYFNIEEEFDKVQVQNAKLHTIYVEGYTDADGNKVNSKEIDKIEDVSADRISFGDATPANTYKADNTNFRYDVNIYVDGKAVKEAVGVPATIRAYIGVKGDANLDGFADAVDASQVLRYYTLLSGGKTAYEVNLSQSKLATNPRNEYEEFAAFLCDVNPDADPPVTRLARKGDRIVDAVDSSQILRFYTLRSNEDNNSKSNKELWTEATAKKS